MATSKPVEEMTWDDLDRIIKSGCKDKGFIERARKALLKKVVGDKPNEQMTSEDLDSIIDSGCKDEELIQKIENSIQARK